MLGIVRALPATFRSRQAAIAGIEAGGFSTGVAQWMSTNLVHDADGFRWRLDFDVMERLLHEFFQTSLWHVLDPGAAGHDIHVLKATESSVISPDVVAQAHRAAGTPASRGGARASSPARGRALDPRRVARGGGGPARGVVAARVEGNRAREE